MNCLLSLSFLNVQRFHHFPISSLEQILLIVYFILGMTLDLQENREDSTESSHRRPHLLPIINILCQCGMFIVTVNQHGFVIVSSVLVAQQCPTLCDPTDYRPPGSSVHGRILEWVAIPFSNCQLTPVLYCYFLRIQCLFLLWDPIQDTVLHLVVIVLQATLG